MVAEASQPEPASLYQQLAAPFDKTFSREVAGQSFTYGIGLYLYEKDGGAAPQVRRQSSSDDDGDTAPASSGGDTDCEECGATLAPLTFKKKPGQDRGDTWSVERLIQYGKNKHGRVL